MYEELDKIFNGDLTLKEKYNQAIRYVSSVGYWSRANEEVAKEYLWKKLYEYFDKDKLMVEAI